MIIEKPPRVPCEDENGESNDNTEKFGKAMEKEVVIETCKVESPDDQNPANERKDERCSVLLSGYILTHIWLPSALPIYSNFRL